MRPVLLSSWGMVERRGMAEPVAPPETESHNTSPLLIVAGTVLAVALVSFLLYSVGGYEGESDVFAGGQRTWKASITIAEPGKPVVSVSVPIEVAEVEAE